METYKSAPVRVYFDASIRRGDRAGSIGAVFTTHMGRIIGEYAERIDASRGSTYAEFEAIVRTLSVLSKMDGVNHLKFYGDCDSVIQILKSDGTMSPSATDMISYDQRVRQMLDDFDYYTFEYIPRAENPADDVADTAYNRTVGHYLWFDAEDGRATRYVEVEP